MELKLIWAFEGAAKPRSCSLRKQKQEVKTGGIVLAPVIENEEFCV
jgi:hypothetical protein